MLRVTSIYSGPVHTHTGISAEGNKDLQWASTHTHTGISAVAYPQLTVFIDCNVAGLEVSMDNPSRVHILQGGVLEHYQDSVCVCYLESS